MYVVAPAIFTACLPQNRPYLFRPSCIRSHAPRTHRQQLSHDALRRSAHGQKIVDTGVAASLATGNP